VPRKAPLDRADVDEEGTEHEPFVFDAEPEDAAARQDLIDMAVTDYAAWRAHLAAGSQQAALRELDARRRVLLVLRDRVVMLVPGASRDGQAHVFHARWRPCARTLPDWCAWRLHREDHAGAPRLQSRHALPLPATATPLELRLSARQAGPVEPGSACVDVAGRHRFEPLLGPQWSVLALLCPPFPT
jgi:hypothetical protein